MMKKDETYYIAKTFDHIAKRYDRSVEKKFGLEFYSLAAKLAGVKEGDKVSLGEQIGELGHCPKCLTPHLHLSVWEKRKSYTSLGTFASIGRLGKNWYPVSPHKYWFDGPYKITCYDPSLKISNTDFKIIYPVQCK